MAFLFIIQTFFGDVPKLNIFVDLGLLVLALWFILRKKNSKNRKKFTKEEQEAIICRWEPELLVTRDVNCPDLKERIVKSKFGKHLVINEKKCLNLAYLSFLGLSEDPDIEENAIKAVRKYGVGSCGPRGFYGTVDVHLELEERLAKFMGVEEAVVYSYGFSTIASAIPAYAKRGDIIFVDEKVNFPIQKGLDASRSHIKFFRHNDMEDLERILAAQEKLDLKNKRKAARTRKFLVIEGIYLNSGQICPLPELIKLRKKYQLRIFIDESISFGTLGHCGRGVTEHFNVPIIDVDLIMATMECALASVGGFCLGSSFIVEHQRLSGLGYCFSAALPPLLTTAAITSLDIIQNNPQIVGELQHVCSKFHDSLTGSSVLRTHFEIVGDRISPVKHLQAENENLLKLFVSKCEEKYVAVSQAAYLQVEKRYIIPSIRLTINRLLKDQDIQIAIQVFEDVLMSITVN